MLTEDLQKLEKKIQEIDSLRPIDFISQFISTIQTDLELSEQDHKNMEKSFNSKMNEFIRSYESHDLPKRMIGYLLYTYMIYYLRKIAIFSYADELGIDPVLFKNQMSLLFKGK